MANSICRSTEDPPYFLVPTRQFTIICYSGCKRSNTLFWSLWYKACTWCTYIHLDRTYIHFDFKNFKTTYTYNFYFQLFFMKLIFKNIKSFKVINLSTPTCERAHGGPRSVFVFPSFALLFKNQLLYLFGERWAYSTHAEVGRQLDN